MSFAKLLGNERNKEILQRLLQFGRISSTFIFAGPDGIGKRQFALTVAKAANCQGSSGSHGFAIDSCDQCAACRRIDAGTYGDVTTVQPEGQFIKIAQTRSLVEDVYYRPREGRQRFLIIDPADRLREEAANSLLKTLEEPPPTSTIILLTSRPDALLQTVRSRAQRLNFAPLAVAEMERYLAENYPRPASDIALLARLTEGRIGQATAFDLSIYRQERRVLIEVIELMVTGENRLRLIKAAEYLGKKEREEFEKELDLLTTLLRDIFLMATGKNRHSVVNIDLIDRLEEISARVGVQRLIQWIGKFNELRSQLKININRQVAMEAALLSLSNAP